MPSPVKIDFVSDVVCPWCAVGLYSLLHAIERIGDDLQVEIHFQPFELNPDLPAEGEDIAGHLQRKYGLSPEQLRANSAALVERAAAVGFRIDTDRRTHIYNTFDAHRLLSWAGTQGLDAQLRLKQALLRAYHGEGRNVSAETVLAAAAVEAGLDGDQATRILATGSHGDDVRALERLYRERGITAVPSVIFNDRHLIQGGQPVEVFEQALRQLSGIAAT